MRGAGASTGKATISGMPEVSDVVAVCKWAAEKYNKKILLVGSSAGTIHSIFLILVSSSDTRLQRV